MARLQITSAPQKDVRTYKFFGTQHPFPLTFHSVHTNNPSCHYLRSNYRLGVKKRKWENNCEDWYHLHFGIRFILCYIDSKLETTKVKWVSHGITQPCHTHLLWTALFYPCNKKCDIPHVFQITDDCCILESIPNKRDQPAMKARGT